MRTPRVIAVAILLSLAGCASSSDEGSGDPQDPGGGGDPGPGPDGETSANETEMYAVATDLSTQVDTWFRFRPDAFEAKVGDRLNITLKAAIGNTYSHSLYIDALNVRLGPIPAEQFVSVVVPLTQAGSFTFYCNEGNHQELGMTGTLTVS